MKQRDLIKKLEDGEFVLSVMVETMIYTEEAMIWRRFQNIRKLMKV